MRKRVELSSLEPELKAILQPGLVEQRDDPVMEDIEKIPQRMIASQNTSRRSAPYSAAGSVPLGPINPMKFTVIAGWPPWPSVRD